jgi:predicted RNase H-like nuclease (RuvC/YqgF family)
MHRILLILVIVLSVAAAGLGFLNRGKLVTTKGELTTALSERDAAKKAVAVSATDLKALKEKSALDSADADKKSAEIMDLREQVAKATSGVADIQKQLSEKEGTIAQQKTDMAAKDARISELESKVNAAMEPSKATDDLKKQLDEKNILNNQLEAKVKDQDAQLDALKKREDQRRNKAMRNGLEGKILAVNPSWNFVVLNLGDRNGVVSNAEMLIKRGSQLIGKIRITSVEPSTSVADIVVNSVRSGLSVQPGDTVIYAGPNQDSPNTP